MPKLYNFQRSGNCYKVRLMAALLGVDYQRVDFTPPSGDHKKPEYLAINPLGQVPAWVEDDGTTICDSQAILVYLVMKYQSGGPWLLDDAAGAAEVTRWLAYTAHEILAGVAFSRAIRLFGRPGDLAAYQEVGRNALGVLDRQLGRHPFLAGDTATIADIAAYPYVSVADEAGLSLADHPNIQAWIGRIEALDGFEPFNPNG